MRHSTRAQQCYGTQVAVRSRGCLLTIARNWQTAAIVGSPSSRRQRRHSTMGPKACLKFELNLKLQDALHRIDHTKSSIPTSLAKSFLQVSFDNYEVYYQ